MVGLLVFGGDCVWTRDLVAVSDEVRSDLETDVAGRVERFDRRGTEPFEPFEPFEFFQNRNFSLENSKIPETFNI